MSKKSVLLIFGLAVVFMTIWVYATQNSSLTFNGESDHWKGNLKITGDRQQLDQELTLTFKDADAPDTPINFSFKTTFGGGEVAGARLRKDQSITFISGGSGGDLTQVPDEEITVNIYWGSFHEELVLGKTK